MNKMMGKFKQKAKKKLFGFEMFMFKNIFIDNKKKTNK